MGPSEAALLILRWYRRVKVAKKKLAEAAFRESQVEEGVDILLSRSDLDGIQLYQSNTVSRQFDVGGQRKGAVPCEYHLFLMTKC